MTRTPLQRLLATNWNAVRQRIDRAREEAGRPEGAVELLAVTKTIEPRVALELFALGQRDLGENRVDELERKRNAFRERGLDPRWHYVGKIQRNKARRVLRAASVLHAVDSLRLLETLERIAQEEELRPRIFLEVKLSPEETKIGLDPAVLEQVVLRAGASPAIELAGLMTLAPRPTPGPQPGESPAGGPAPGPGTALGAARGAFARLAGIAAGLAEKAGTRRAFASERVELSMGMSGDLEAAILEGSDVVRVGSALFKGLAGAQPAAQADADAEADAEREELRP